MIVSMVKLALISAFISIFAVSNASATNILIINNDAAGEGLNDPTVVATVPGNSATTLGEQYFNVFQAAANYWEERLDSPVDIRVRAQLDLLSCSTFSATLGSAGPLNVFRDFSNAPLSNTWFTAAQSNSLAGFDLDNSADDISMTFNSGIGTPNCFASTSWWLGINSPAPSGTVNFYETVLHELAHGLGFLTLVNSSGQRLADTNDAFMVNMFDRTLGLSWPNMNDAQRAISSVNTGNLVWTGTQVTQNSGSLNFGLNNGSVRLFAPSPFQGGSSLSHWDTVLAPDELMEPFATLTSDDCTTTSAFRDIGWNTKGNTSEFSFTSAARSGFETIGSVSISVERSFDCGRTPQGAASVTVQSSDGSALSGSDYSLVNQILTWAAGETGVRTINIPIFDDGFEEERETFTVNLSNPTGNATLGNIAAAIITIQDEPDDTLCFPVKAANGNVAVVCL